MRVPTRKGGKYINEKPDPKITSGKFDELKIHLKKLKEIVNPRLAKEVKKLAADGDFSENAAYQIAKGKLRGANQKIKELEDFLGKAEIIKTSDNLLIQIGHKVRLQLEDKEIKYQILGSSEVNLSKGIISHQSPLGHALLGKGVGETAELRVGGQIVRYKVLNIE
ncbi:transcription elongation factor GreA [bacterium]|jgi:transcription elongation factor GreA|nr:transcription elongation factor GreA [bacterium]MBT4649150.1 transcription elongation factor GreA [bacterium]